MDLDHKSSENLKIAHYCLQSKAFNAGASRAYYALFQKMKVFLIKQNFNYRDFLISIQKENDKDFSHGTIKDAVRKCMMTKGIALSVLQQFKRVDELYSLRKKADYYNDFMVFKKTCEDCMKDSELLIGIIEGME